uniref:Uncharacterized protein n=1 Tax=Romanomermis culicivorax TaxID=13658 RepID=A0A915J326_ROMCU
MILRLEKIEARLQRVERKITYELNLIAQLIVKKQRQNSFVAATTATVIAGDFANVGDSSPSSIINRRTPRRIFGADESPLPKRQQQRRHCSADFESFGCDVSAAPPRRRFFPRCNNKVTSTANVKCFNIPAVIMRSPSGSERDLCRTPSPKFP